MRAFVTGSSGFVGSWLVPHLRSAGDDVVEVPGSLDVTDEAALASALGAAEPEVVYHLAGFSHVGASWKAPAEALRVNAIGTVSVIEAALACPSRPAVLVVSSAEVYGKVGPGELPLTEDSPVRPLSPYAVSKACAELVGAAAHRAHGLAVLTVRPFNHVGPGQAPSFVVSAMAKRIVEAQRAGAEAIRVGNLSARRDLTDVRDVVRAYRLLAVHGESGEVYNVCSGTDVSIADVVRQLMDIAGVDLRLEEDPALTRPVDVPALRGDASRLRERTGWRPEIDLGETLASVLGYWRSELPPTS
ncbi:MAG: GDP-mannose 4,6-dehydratase [Acidimicrobiales bacterium]